jgi:cytoskeletal protein RodZ
MFEEIGRQLQQVREKRCLSIEEIAQAIYIRSRYLEALEKGDLSVMVSQAQARGFLRSYAEYLGIDSEELLARSPGADPSNEVRTSQSEQTVVRPVGEGELEADAIFAGIGRDLRQRRELLGLTCEEIEQHTRIPARYITLMEAGQMERFPSPVQARGMLHNYTAFLDLHPDQLLLRYAEGLQARLAARQQPQKRDRKQARKPILPLWIRSFFSIELTVVVVVVLALGTFGIWVLSRVLTLQTSQPVPPTAPPLAEVLIPSSTPTITPTVTLFAPPEGQDTLLEEGGDQLEDDTGGEITVAEVVGNVQISVIVNQRAYLRIMIDGEVQFDGRVIPGAAYSYSASDRIEILTGNAAAIQVYYNQRDMGPLGIFGEVVNLVYTVQGIQTPTLQPTATIDVNVTPSLTPTSTSTPTVMPTVAPGILP